MWFTASVVDIDGKTCRPSGAWISSFGLDPGAYAPGKCLLPLWGLSGRPICELEDLSEVLADLYPKINQHQAEIVCFQ